MLFEYQSLTLFFTRRLSLGDPVVVLVLVLDMILCSLTLNLKEYLPNFEIQIKILQSFHRKSLHKLISELSFHSRIYLLLGSIPYRSLFVFVPIISYR